MTAIINKIGQIIQIIHANEETIRLNVPLDCKSIEEDPPHLNMYYDNGWLEMPLQPSPNHTFDYETKVWSDQRSIEDVKNQKWNEIKQQRDSLEFGGFSFNEYIFDSDIKSQNRIIVASNMNKEVEWTTKDNFVVLLNSSKLKDFLKAMMVHINECHEKGRIARQKITEAKTIKEIEKINF